MRIDFCDVVDLIVDFLFFYIESGCQINIWKIRDTVNKNNALENRQFNQEENGNKYKSIRKIAKTDYMYTYI